VASPTTPGWAERILAATLTSVDADALNDARSSVRPSLSWIDEQTGHSASYAAVDRLAAHSLAWSTIVSQDDVALDDTAFVAEGDAVPVDASTLALALGDIAASLDEAMLVLLGPVHRPTAAYMCSAATAGLLLGAAHDDPGVPIEALLADLAAGEHLAVLELDRALFDAPSVRPFAAESRPNTDHLVVVEAADLRTLLLVLPTIDPAALVVVRSSDDATVLADPIELLSAYVQVAHGEIVVAASAFLAPQVLAAGLAEAHPNSGGEGRFVAGGALAVAGPAAALLDLLQTYLPTGASDVALLTDAYLSGAIVLDTSGALFAVPEQTGTRHVVIGSRLVDAASGASPAVLVDAGDHERFVALRSELEEARQPRPGHDLARLFRYDDAVATPSLTSVDADIVTVGLWTPEFCASVIRLAEAADAWSADEHDPVPGAEVSLVAICPPLFSHLQTHVSRLVMPALRTVWPEMAETPLHDAFVIKYAAGPHAELRLHHDIAQISGAVRLNSGFVGGELEFPRQSWHNGGVPVGALTVWPSLVTHPHRARPIEAGVKYGLTLWWKLPD
jgi:hypothetical protein